MVLASDYDGTLAFQGKVDSHTLAALDRLLGSGRKLILVTGRELNDLKSVFPEGCASNWSSLRTAVCFTTPRRGRSARLWILRIQQLGLELQLSFNKGAVMVLPSGVNQQTGLGAALKVRVHSEQGEITL